MVRGLRPPCPQGLCLDWPFATICGDWQSLIGREEVAPPARPPGRFALCAAPPRWRRRASWFRGPVRRRPARPLRGLRLAAPLFWLGGAVAGRLGEFRPLRRAGIYRFLAGSRRWKGLSIKMISSPMRWMQSQANHGIALTGKGTIERKVKE